MQVRDRVTADFGVDLEAPGERSDRAIKALLSRLGVVVVADDQPDDADPWTCWEGWERRVDAAARAGLPRLLEAVSHPDVEIRRMAASVLAYCPDQGVAAAVRGLEVDDEATRLALAVAIGVHEGAQTAGDELMRFGSAFGAVLAERDEPVADVLMWCVGPCGDRLTELPWADPGWPGHTFVHPDAEPCPSWFDALEAVMNQLPRVPRQHVRWLQAMAEKHPDLVPDLADSAACSGDPALVETYGTALLAHDAPRVRRAAMGMLSPHWRSPAYEDGVAALLDDPVYGRQAAAVLARLGDRRGLPATVERVDRRDLREVLLEVRGNLLRYVARKLIEHLPPRAAAAVMRFARHGADPAVLQRPVAAELARRLTDQHLADPDDPDVLAALSDICMAVVRFGGVSPEMRDRLRVLATAPSIRVRQRAQFALLESGETGWLVPVLVAEIAGHPLRTGSDGPHDGGFGRRADDTACVWLGRIGPPAVAAVPVLRAVLAETGEAGDARPAAAEAYWRITGDAPTALAALDGLGGDDDLATRAQEVAARIRA